MSPRQRSVRFEASWETSRALVEPDARRFDEICVGIQWWMENDAEGCATLGSTQLRVAKAIEIPGNALIRAFFTVNPDDQVSAWWVERTPTAEDEE